MRELNCFSDLQEQFHNFVLVVDEHNEINKGKQDLTVIINKCTEEIERLKESEQKLTQQVQTLSKNLVVDDSLNGLYIKLKDKYNVLQAKFDKSQETIKELQEKLIWEKNEITEDYVDQIKKLEVTIERLENEIRIKDCEHYSELEGQKSIACFQYDNMVSQLNVANQNLYDSNSSCNRFREELITFQTHTANNMDRASKRIEELECKLQMTQHQLQIANEKLCKFIRSENSVYSRKEAPEMQQIVNRPPMNLPKVYSNSNSKHSINKSVKLPYSSVSTKYMSLNAEQECDSEEDFVEKPIKPVNEIPSRNYQQPASATSNNMSKNVRFSTNNRPSLPPLIQISASNQRVEMGMKKRKLYDPDQLNFMPNIDDIE